ncbi:hypothetical protein ACIBG5_20800 [Kribbella sp. NPDC050241]|uniref:hypothetical protein n=1 Tax=Kribbella sp. NPDC050241 TaxID=3364115 RepID=UPI00378F16AF
MRSPRLIYGLVAGVLVVAGFLLPRYLADRSQPELGDTVVVPAATSPSTPPPTANPRPTAAVAHHDVPAEHVGRSGGACADDL